MNDDFDRGYLALTELAPGLWIRQVTKTTWHVAAGRRTKPLMLVELKDEQTVPYYNVTLHKPLLHCTVQSGTIEYVIREAVNSFTESLNDSITSLGELNERIDTDRVRKEVHKRKSRAKSLQN